jgi:adenosine kinase
MQKTGWSDEEILSKVTTRVVTLGSDGAKVEALGSEVIHVGVPEEKSKIDPTGVGDAFRSGFLAGVAWEMSYERCAQLGSMLATYVIETKGTQEYRFSREGFIRRFEERYGSESARELSEHLTATSMG